MRKMFVVFAVALALTGCIKSETKSYTDQNYKEAKFTKIIVNLISLPATSRMTAEKIVMERLKEAGFDAVEMADVLPPTRNFTPEEVIKIVAESGYEYMLAINVTGDTSSTSLAGIYNYSYGNATINGNRVRGQATTVSTPIIASEGKTALQAMIFDVKNGDKAWEASILTEANGTAFVGNVQSIAHSAIGSIIDKLKADGHL